MEIAEWHKFAVFSRKDILPSANKNSPSERARQPKIVLSSVDFSAPFGPMYDEIS